MAANAKPVSINDLFVDARHLAPGVRDLPNGERQGMRTEQPGFPTTIKEIADNQPLYGEKAGITARNFQDLMDALKRVAEFDEVLPSARKLLEVLEESRAYDMDQIQRMVSSIASSVEGRAAAYKDDELLARYEQTRAYRSAAGFKAARTRLRNQEPATPEAPEAE
ncbi:MAG TPA: hypothetical protein VNM90_02145 [Haliangium sp.]|nr:hypothetical protein [Haliangium sp.]